MVSPSCTPLQASPGVRRKMNLSISKHYMALARGFSGSQPVSFPLRFSFYGDRWTIVSNWSRSMWFSPLWIHNAQYSWAKSRLIRLHRKACLLECYSYWIWYQVAFNSDPLFNKNNMFLSPVDSYTAVIPVLSATPFCYMTRRYRFKYMKPLMNVLCWLPYPCVVIYRV
jgi:hypothetical protein